MKSDEEKEKNRKKKKKERRSRRKRRKETRRCRIIPTPIPNTFSPIPLTNTKKISSPTNSTIAII
jgi:hypothetical protein